MGRSSLIQMLKPRQLFDPLRKSKAPINQCSTSLDSGVAVPTYFSPEHSHTSITMSSIGVLNEAYFVGRHELIQWVNETLQTSIGKIEECANGWQFCQLVDSVHPGKVALKKVKFDARLEHEFIGNYKVLQTAFDKLRVQKVIPVDRLIKGKYQDNLEFLQWLYSYCQGEGGAQRQYDPVRRREASGGAKGAKDPHHRAQHKEINKENTRPQQEPRRDRKHRRPGSKSGIPSLKAMAQKPKSQIPTFHSRIPSLSQLSSLAPIHEDGASSTHRSTASELSTARDCQTPHTARSAHSLCSDLGSTSSHSREFSIESSTSLESEPISEEAQAYMNTLKEVEAKASKLQGSLEAAKERMWQVIDLSERMEGKSAGVLRGIVQRVFFDYTPVDLSPVWEIKQAQIKRRQEKKAIALITPQVPIL